MLEILGQPSNPDIIQAHLKKLFAGIHSVSIESASITSINSVEGEVVPLPEPVQVGTPGTTDLHIWLLSP